MSSHRAPARLVGVVMAAAAAAALTVVPANAAPTWAAIVYSPATGAHGWSWNAASKADAIDLATASCFEYGGTDCQHAASNNRGCLALADSRTHWSGGLGPTLIAAENDALAVNGGGRILVSVCTG